MKPFNRAFEFVAHYITTTLVFVIITLLFFTVDQIRHVFPAMDSNVLFHVYTWSIVAGYLLVLSWILIGLGHNGLTKAIAKRANWPLAIAFFMLAVVCFSLAWYGPELLRDGRLVDSTTFTSAGVWLIVATLGTVGARFKWGNANWHPLPSKAVDVLVRSLLAIGILTVLGEMVWCIALSMEFASPRAFTVGALCHAALLALSFTAFFDTWSAVHGRPAWVVGVVCVLGFTIWGLHSPTLGKARQLSTVADKNVYYATPNNRPLEPNDHSRQPSDIPVTETSQPNTWLGQLLLRLFPDGKPASDDPVIFVAASGGGSRAALFTSLVYQDLRREPIEVSASDGSAAKSYKVDDHIALISSVSGGTLASACYVSPGYQKIVAEQGEEREQPMHSDPIDILKLMNVEAKKLAGNQKFQDAHPLADIEAIQKECESHLNNQELWWFQKSIYVDDMGTDFMAPLLRGALHAMVERGQSVSGYWKKVFGLSETNLARAGETRLKELAGAHPLLFCNAADVSDGGAVIMGFPEVDAGLFLPAAAGVKRKEKMPVRGLLDVSPGTGVELPLADMVRLSANFPWGFQVPGLQIGATADPVTGVPPRQLRLIDGGVFDNTGITTIRSLFGRLEELSARRGSLMQVQAFLVLRELRRRGVILLEIDSGAKPEPPGFVSQTFSGVLEPIVALNNASYGTAAYMRDRNLLDMKTTLVSTHGKDLQEDLKSLIHRSPISDEKKKTLHADLLGQIDFCYHIVAICNEEENVMTAWALGPEDKAKIFVRFLVIRDELRRKLADVVATHRFVSSRLTDIEAAVKTLEEKLNNEDLASFDDDLTLAVRNLTNLVKARDALQLDTELVENLATLYSASAPVEEIAHAKDDLLRFYKVRKDVDQVPFSKAMQLSVPELATKPTIVGEKSSVPANVLDFRKLSGNAANSALQTLESKFEQMREKGVLFQKEKQTEK